MEIPPSLMKKIETAYDPAPSHAALDGFYRKAAQTVQVGELRPRPLTPTEKKVAAGLASGWTERMMAQNGAVSEKTIRTHVNAIRAKAGPEAQGRYTDDFIVHRLYQNGMAAAFYEAIEDAAFKLTPTQKKLAKMMLEGKSNKQICQALDIREITRKTHATKISKAVRKGLDVDLKRLKKMWKVPQLFSFVIHHPGLIRRA